LSSLFFILRFSYKLIMSSLYSLIIYSCWNFKSSFSFSKSYTIYCKDFSRTKIFSLNALIFFC
jgi:hypothetical protein